MEDERLNLLINELEKLHHRLELSQTVTPEYFEPGMMEYLDKSDGTYDPQTGGIMLRFEAKGTRYDGRTEIIEKMKSGDTITVLRDRENPYNSNNFTMVNGRGSNVGNMPMELCNAIAPLYDSGMLVFENAFASFVDPITQRSRHAKQAMLFVELHCRVFP
ncbi:MAG: HIRAN domain-containing protein [Oscillospiraceae bacterium]|nr:HIRAN domain-containing protein [Oscillospiraceae bacterium]